MKINLKTVRDDRFQFAYSFDLDSGFYYRTGLINAEGGDSGRDPFRASFPHLLDVGIMGHCEHGSRGLCVKAGVACYQDGWHKQEPNMGLEDYRWLVNQCQGRMFQIALGGRGDPEMHEEFEAILSYSREHNIVPNMTTSGFGLTAEKADLMKTYCGAVAVSWYRSEYTLRAIELLVEKGVKTNIHFVLGNHSLAEAYRLLTGGLWPEGINRIIFLLHKPVGLGRSGNVLEAADPKVREFFQLFNEEKYCNLAGFDSCCVPGLINYSPRIHPDSIDTCEGARYSAYVTPDLKMTPCSFDQEMKWSYDLKGHTVEEAWESRPFEAFRTALKTACPHCAKQSGCLGGCPIKREIVLCEQVQEVKG